MQESRLDVTLYISLLFICFLYFLAAGLFIDGAIQNSNLASGSRQVDFCMGVVCFLLGLWHPYRVMQVLYTSPIGDSSHADV